MTQKHIPIRAWHINDNGTRVGYSGAFIDMYHLKEIFKRYGIDETNLVHPLLINKEEVSEERMHAMFQHLRDLPPRNEAFQLTANQKESMVVKGGIDLIQWTVLKDAHEKLELIHPRTGERKVYVA